MVTTIVTNLEIMVSIVYVGIVLSMVTISNQIWNYGIHGNQSGDYAVHVQIMDNTLHIHGKAWSTLLFCACFH